MPNAKNVQLMSKDLSIAGNAAIDRFLSNGRPAPLTFMGVPIVWDTYEDTFGMTPEEIGRANFPNYNGALPMTKTDHLYKTYFGIDLAKPAKPKKLPPYRTVGVRFIHGHNLLKVYTYRVRKAAKVHLGQEVIVESNPPTGWTKSLAVIVRIDTTPQDNGPFNYLFIEQAVKAL